jgi:hypothetical protein
MQENPPHLDIETEESLPVPPTQAEKLTQIADINNEAIDSFYKQKEEDEKRANEIRSSFEDPSNRAFDKLSETDKAEATVQKNGTEENNSSSNIAKNLRKIGVAIALTLGVASHASGQSTGGKHSDKEGIKKEATITSKSFELDQSTKDSWDNYRTWYWNYVKEHAIAESVLQTTAGAQQMMNEYKNETGNTITPEIVGKVQNFFQGYRLLILKAVKEGKASIGGADTAHFMEGISSEDKIAGEETMKFEIPEDYETINTQLRMMGPEVNGSHSNIILSQDKTIADIGYVDTSKYDDHSSK